MSEPNDIENVRNKSSDSNANNQLKEPEFNHPLTGEKIDTKFKPLFENQINGSIEQIEERGELAKEYREKHSIWRRTKWDYVLWILGPLLFLLLAFLQSGFIR